MPKSRAVNIVHSPKLILRFPERQHSDLPLRHGISRLCRDPDFDRGLIVAREGSRSLIDFCLDARGLWLHVAEGVAGVHVNGRPVQSLAMLCLGDVIHCEGVQMYVGEEVRREQGEGSAPPPMQYKNRWATPLLRGLCGIDHGRALLIDHPLRVGGNGADIALEGAEEVEAKIFSHQEQVWLQVSKFGRTVRLNGEQFTGAVQLRHGDQLVFAPDRRYLLELPGKLAGLPFQAQQEQKWEQGDTVVDVEADHGRQVPWLLLAAFLSGAFLLALLLFGVK